METLHTDEIHSRLEILTAPGIFFRKYNEGQNIVTATKEVTTPCERQTMEAMTKQWVG